MFKTNEARQAAWLTLGLWLLSELFFIATVEIQGVALTGPLLATMVVFSILGLALSVVLYQIARHTRHRGALDRVGLMLLAVLVASTALSFGEVLIMDVTRALVGSVTPPPRFSVGARIVINLASLIWVLGVQAAIYLILQANAVLREHELQLADARAAASQAEAAASAARLAALRYQLNPHFLFNTLNAVSAAVITHRNDEAESMLSKLADFLRVTLVADPEAMTPMEDEMATLQAYLEIESVRFRERLALEFVCPDDLRTALVPSFLLQPLIENAIKHAVSPTSATVTIRLEVVRDGEDLVVLVQDDGEAAQGGETAARPGAGVGLRNVRLRLEALYGARGVLQATPLARGFLAMVRMPLHRADALPLTKAA